MKSLFKFLLLLFVFLTNAFAVQSPYRPQDESLFNDKIPQVSSGSVLIGNTNGRVEVFGNTSAFANSAGQGLPRMARATFNTQTGTQTLVGSYGLGVYLPAKAVILKTQLYINAAFEDTGAGTVAFKCEDANNIWSAFDATSLSTGVLVAGAVSGSGTGVTDIASQCELTASIATVNQDKGSATVYVLYTVHD